MSLFQDFHLVDLFIRYRNLLYFPIARDVFTLFHVLFSYKLQLNPQELYPRK